MTTLRAVLFDLGGVVFRYAPERRWQAFAKVAGLSAREVEKRLSDSGYSQSCDKGALRGDRAYKEAIRLLGTRLSMDRFHDLWISAFIPDEETIAVALELKRNTAIALASNNADFTRVGLEQRFGESMQPFMPRVFSADLGITKPDPRLFNHALDLMGRTAAETLLVDDAPKNTDTAAALGMMTHTFIDAAGLRADLEQRGML